MRLIDPLKSFPSLLNGLLQLESRIYFVFLIRASDARKVDQGNHRQHWDLQDCLNVTLVVQSAVAQSEQVENCQSQANTTHKTTACQNSLFRGRWRRGQARRIENPELLALLFTLQIPRDCGAVALFQQVIVKLQRNLVVP